MDIRRARRVRRSLLVMTSFSSVMLALAAAGIFAFRYVQSRSVLRLAVTAGHANNVALAEAIQHQLRFGEPRMHVEVAKAEADVASATAMDEGRGELAIVRSDVATPKHGEARQGQSFG